MTRLTGPYLAAAWSGRPDTMETAVLVLGAAT